MKRAVVASSKMHIQKEIESVLYNMLQEDYLDNIAMAVSAKVPEYDPDWIETEYPVGPAEMKLEDAEARLVSALAQYLTANCNL